MGSELDRLLATVRGSRREALTGQVSSLGVIVDVGPEARYFENAVLLRQRFQICYGQRLFSRDALLTVELDVADEEYVQLDPSPHHVPILLKNLSLGDALARSQRPNLKGRGLLTTTKTDHVQQQRPNDQPHSRYKCGNNLRDDTGPDDSLESLVVKLHPSSLPFEEWISEQATNRQPRRVRPQTQIVTTHVISSCIASLTPSWATFGPVAPGAGLLCFSLTKALMSSGGICPATGPASTSTDAEELQQTKSLAEWDGVARAYQLGLISDSNSLCGKLSTSSPSSTRSSVLAVGSVKELRNS